MGDEKSKDQKILERDAARFRFLAARFRTLTPGVSARIIDNFILEGGPFEHFGRIVDRTIQAEELSKESDV